MTAWLAPQWSAPAGVRSLSTLRETDLNLLPLPSAPRWLRQVHGVQVAPLEARAPLPDAATADAAVTRTPGVVCAIRTADCLPVLLAAGDGSAVAAAHAGWRGMAAGVLEATVAGMRAGISAHVPLVAWLGPAIGPLHFEVGDEVRAAYMDVDPAAAGAFVRNSRGRWQCDLYELARQRLLACGISDIGGGGLCTYEDPVRFYSHRRDVQHLGLPTTGRMATLIWIESAP